MCGQSADISLSLFCRLLSVSSSLPLVVKPEQVNSLFRGVMLTKCSLSDTTRCSQVHEETEINVICVLQTEVVRKVATSFFCLLVFLSVCKVFPVERNIDDDFIANMPFYVQVVYLYLSMLTTRPKYYFVWTLGGCFKVISVFLVFLAASCSSMCHSVHRNSVCVCVCVCVHANWLQRGVAMGVAHC